MPAEPYLQEDGEDMRHTSVRLFLMTHVAFNDWCCWALQGDPIYLYEPDGLNLSRWCVGLFLGHTFALHNFCTFGKLAAYSRAQGKWEVVRIRHPT